jgi:hypothetical protein
LINYFIISIQQIIKITACSVLFSLFACSAFSQQDTFLPLRYNENYEYLKNDTSTNFYEQLKYLPFNKSKDIYASFGGELRYQYNLYRNEDFGELEADKRGFFLLRHMLHSDIHIKKHLRVFAQLKANVEEGRANGPRVPLDEDRLSAHQLFLDANLINNTNQLLAVRFGRQELLYGSQRLISVREGPNNRQSFDGAKLYYKNKKWQMDAFYTHPVFINPGAWDDKRRTDIDFGGVYAVINKVPVVGNLDLYALYLRRENGFFTEGTQQEKRYSVGTRIWQRKAGWMYDFEALYQFGKFGSGNISAWTASVNTSYTFQNNKRNPTIGLKTEFISGDKKRGDGNLQTFNPLFPRGAYFGLAALIGPANLFDIHPSFAIDFSKKLTLNTDYDLFWRYSLDDGLYGPVGNFLRPDNGSRSRFIGHQVMAQLEYEVNKYVYIAPEIGYFITGNYLKESGDGKNMFLFTVTSTLKF